MEVAVLSLRFSRFERGLDALFRDSSILSVVDLGGGGQA